MIEFPKWKYALVCMALFFSALYFLPNLFPQDPAIQLSANRGFVVDEALKGRVEGTLTGAKLEFDRVERDKDRLLIRFPSTQAQLAASEKLHEDPEIGNSYTIALNMASNIPNWLSFFGAKPLVLGLDLRGGVHFLMQVDQQVVQQKLEERHVGDIQAILREKKVSFRSVSVTPNGLLIALVNDAERQTATTEIEKALSEDLLVENLGATDLLAKIRPEKVLEAKRLAIEQNTTTLRNRVASLAEPVIQRQGSDRIVVQLPGIQDTAQAKRLLGATATLEYRAVDTANNAEDAASTGKIPPESRLFYTREKPLEPKRPVLLKKSIIASGAQLTNATSGTDPQSGTPMVSVQLDAVGGQRMLDFTSESVGKPMAVVYVEQTPVTKIVDGKEVQSTLVTEEVISVATIQGVFSNRFQTTGLDSPREAADLALLLRAGSLAAPVSIVEERVIGPSLGADNIRSGLTALLVGLLACVLFTGIYYRTFGAIAVVGLVANLVMLGAVLGIFGATLTLPGIAGVVLTLGMAIDANVLINERIREELRNGNTPLNSIKAGYEKAWGTIIDSNLTTLIAGLALFGIGSGPIRGFAMTLCIGIMTTMFTAVVVTEAIVAFMYRKQRKLTHVSV